MSRAFAAALRERLPAGRRRATTRRPTLAASAELSRSYRVNLDVLALVALFTGGLLVFSTQALAVVRRRAQFALLRVLGVTRRRLDGADRRGRRADRRSGQRAGHCGRVRARRARAARRSAPISDRVISAASRRRYTLDPRALASFFALGVAAAVLGSVVPALEAAHAPPAQALKAGDEERAFARLRPPLPGLAALAIGALRQPRCRRSRSCRSPATPRSRCCSSAR